MHRYLRFQFLAAALLLFLLALTGCGESTPRLARLSPGDVVLAFGDSLTYGTGATPETSYPAVLSQLIGRNVVRAGVPGEVTAQGLVRLPAVLEEVNPRLVLLCLGGNDMLRRGDPGETAENLRAMVRLIRERGADVVLIAVPEPKLLGDPPPFYAAIAGEFGVPVETGVIKEVLYSARLKSDPIHPNAEGYREMATAVARLLKQAGAI
jgi:lysophospholipase L1-like esterase